MHSAVETSVSRRRRIGFAPFVAMLAATTASPASHAAPPLSGPYVQLGGGVDFLQNETRSAIPALGVPRRGLAFDLPGATGELSAGWGFGNGLRVEVEGNYLNDHVRKPVGTRAPLRAGGFEQQYGGFANVLYDIPLRLPVQPYIGVGAGGQELELDNINTSTPGFVFPGKGEAREGSFAYQAIAGFSIPIAPVPGLAFTVEYRMIGLPDPLEAIPYAEVRVRTFYPPPVFLTPAGFGQQGFGPGGPFYNPAAPVPAPTVPAPVRVVTVEHASEKFGNVFHHSIMLGLRYAFFGAPPKPARSAPTATAPAPAAARTYLVFFNWDRAALTPRARQIVAEAAQNSTRIATTTIAVDGYADTSHALPGTRGQAYNLRLSLRRAEAVRAELVRDGVPARAISVHGYGDTHLLVPTGPDIREPQNRRVEIVLH